MTPDRIVVAVLAWLILSPFLGSAIGRRLKHRNTNNDITRRGTDR